MHYYIECGQLIMYELVIIGAATAVYFTDVEAISNKFHNMVSNVDMQTICANIGANALYKYSNIKVQCRTFISTLCNKYWMVGTAVHCIQYLGNYLYCKWQNRSIEPITVQWMSTNILSRDPSNINVVISEDNERQVNYSYNFSERYGSNGEWPRERALEHFTKECTIRAIFSSIEDFEILMMMKSDGLYLARVIYLLGRDDDVTDIPGEPDHSISWEPSSVRFLSVEYCHPFMDKAIPLEIDRGFYLEGNHLLSAAFVRRTLEYQNDANNYYFDMNYTLKIMDSNIDTFELTSGEYVVMESDGYNVVKY